MEPENIYYVGIKQSEAEASFHNQTMDGYFAGSITQYGNNKRGNIAYNACCKVQLSKGVDFFERNDKILSAFVNEQCRKIVASVPDAYFYPFDPDEAAHIPTELQDRVICCNSIENYKVLDSKFKIREIFKDILPFAPYRYMRGNEIIAKINDGTYPDKEQVVAQIEYGYGGFGTIIINKDYFKNATFKEKAIKELSKDETYLVSDYVENIASASVHIIVSNNEVLMMPSSVHGYKEHHKLSYSGLKEFTQLSKSQQEKAKKAALDFGYFVQKSEKYKMRGWLHLDAVFAKTGEVYVMEINPRFGGPIGLINRVFRAAGLKSVFEYNYMAFYNEKTNFEPDIKKLKLSGIYRHAKVEIKDGVAVSIEPKHINREGFDLTIIREDDIYTHSVYELQD